MSNKHRETENRPFTVHLCAEIDLEVLCIVKHVEEGTALVKLGDAEEKRITVSWTMRADMNQRMNEVFHWTYDINHQTSGYEIKECLSVKT